jgi:hypothetical protein
MVNYYNDFFFLGAIHHVYVGNVDILVIQAAVTSGLK